MHRHPGSLARITAAVALLSVAEVSAQQGYARINKLFDGGAGFYHSYRIPSIVRATGNVLLAFAEGRVDDPDDWGNINLVYRRSTDNGKSWSTLREIAGVGPGSWTNPTSVYEAPWAGHPRGRVHLFFNWHSGTHKSMATIRHGDRRTYYTYSDDDGLTWAKRRNLTGVLLPKGFKWDAVGPGAGIQKRVAPNVGRLIVPATKRNFHSDDHGATWKYTMMPTTGSADITGESTVAECLDGSLLRNDRATGSYWPKAKRRWVSRGQIGSFPTPVPQANLLDPRSHASMLRYNLNSPARLIFLNSDSTVNRRRMKVRISYDDGKTWARDRWLYVLTPPDFHLTIGRAQAAGKGGYSAMTKTGDFHVAALVEVDERFTHRYTTNRSIDFHRFNLAWIRKGKPDPLCPELTKARVGTLSNVTEKAFVFDGRRLHLVKEVFFDGVPITSRSPGTWSSGWFRVVHSNRIEVYPPQGRAPGTHSIAVASSRCKSPPVQVTLQRNEWPALHGPSRPTGPFQLLGSRGSSSSRTLAFLAVSTSFRPTVLPGLVSLGIGNGGSVLAVLDTPIRGHPSTGVFRWRFRALRGAPPLYFQAALFDPLAAAPLPLPVTNVELIDP